jgi:hypothetical protein
MISVSAQQPRHATALSFLPRLTLPARFELPHTHPREYMRFSIEHNISEGKRVVWREQQVKIFECLSLAGSVSAYN